MASAPLGAALRHIHHLFAAGTVAGARDAQLLDRFLARRDEEAFAALVGRHGPMVLAVCRAALRDPDDAEDVFQATFLLLARKGSSVRDPEALGGWLHRVALRVVARANAAAARRRAHERRAGRLKVAVGPGGGPREELAAALHAEVDRLPARFRLPVVLHHLESLPQAEVARRLRWSERTLQRRLADARERLRSRLVRRGVALSGGMLVAALDRGAGAAVPESLAASAARAAAQRAAGGAVSAILAGWARTLTWGRLPAGVAVVLTLSALTWASALLDTSREEGTDVAVPPRPTPPLLAAAGPKEAASPGPAATEKEPSKMVEIRGRVVGPDGKPSPGARIFAFRPNYDRYGPTPQPEPRTLTDAEGRFAVEVPVAEPAGKDDEKGGRRAVPVIAMADGFGPAIVEAPSAGEESTLRLVPDDVPIEGRVLDTDGQPVAGATVRVRTLMWHPSGNLDPWIETLRGEQAAYSVQYRVLKAWNGREVEALVGPATTGPDGRFRLDGVGRERVVGLWIEAPTIETMFVHARTRPGETMRYPEFSRYDTESRKVTYHGARFDHVAGPTQVVVGRVRDADTGRPLIGAVVQCSTALGNPLRYVQTTTDERGDYRLTGLSTRKDPLGNDNHLLVRPPEGEPYPMVKRRVPQGKAVAPVTIDVAMKRGAWITGRVFDKATGRPVSANLEYFVFKDDPHVKDYPSFGYPNVATPLSTKEDGTFRIVGIPGRGILGARKGNEGYRIGVGSEQFKEDEDKELPGRLRAVPASCMPTNFNTLVEVNIPEGADSVTCDVPLDPGHSIAGRAVGPDGRPRAGLWVFGQADYFRMWRQPRDPETFEVTALGPDDRRLILVAHEADRLAGMVVAKGSDPDTMTVELRPWAEVTGRLVDGEGRPVASAALKARDYVSEREKGLSVGSVPDEFITLEDDGRFRIRGLLPGLTYKFHLMTTNRIVDQPIVDLTVQPGEVKDLGDVTTKRP